MNVLCVTEDVFRVNCVSSLLEFFPTRWSLLTDDEKREFRLFRFRSKSVTVAPNLPKNVSVNLNTRIRITKFANTHNQTRRCAWKQNNSRGKHELIILLHDTFFGHKCSIYAQLFALIYEWRSHLNFWTFSILYQFRRWHEYVCMYTKLSKATKAIASHSHVTIVTVYHRPFTLISWNRIQKHFIFFIYLFISIH